MSIFENNKITNLGMKGPKSIVNEGKLRFHLNSSLVPLLLITVFVSLPHIQAATKPTNNRIIKLDHSNLAENLENQITDPSNNFLSDEKNIWKTFVIKKNGYIIRKRRELRSPRKIEDSSTQKEKPTNYPFVMAEMVPGSVKTRHPSIIAINNCPAFYIADHEGKCKQVFQYTVNFGQHSPKYDQNSFQPSRSLFDTGNRFSSNFLSNSRNIPGFFSDRSRFGIFRQQQSTTVTEDQPPPTTTSTPLVNKYIPPPTTSVPPSSLISPRLLAVLRTAAKKRLDFLVKSASNNSGETNDNSDLDSLRKRILEALKSSSDKESSSMDQKKNDKNWNNKKTHNVKDELGIKTTTVDYDD